jgi:ATP-dependent exoDNAse (exonuclease V) alpha subunit
VIATEIVERVLATHVPALNADQAAAVRVIAAEGRGLEAMTALAGTGKTTMVGVLADAYRQAGWRVIGAAPTARAARQMRELAGIEADTMHALLARLRRDGGLDARTVLVLDEAGMAPTRRSAALLAHAELAGAKVIAIGDPGQLAAVEGGGWLAALARDREPGPYLTYKQGAIAVHETEIGALLEVRDGWRTAQHRYGRRAAVMIARDNLTRERLNRAARALLKRDGVLDERGVYIGGWFRLKGRVPVGTARGRPHAFPAVAHRCCFDAASETASAERSGSASRPIR